MLVDEAHLTHYISDPQWAVCLNVVVIVIVGCISADEPNQWTAIVSRLWQHNWSVGWDREKLDILHGERETETAK